MSNSISIVSIEGNISSGKSTLLQYVKDNIPSKFSKVFDVIPEGVEAYQRFFNYNPLRLMYENPKENSAMAQLHFTRCHADEVIECLERTKSEKGPTLVLSDRSLFSPKSFIDAHYTLGNINSFVRDSLIYEMERLSLDILKRYSAEYVGMIYIDTPSDVCMQRIFNRARNGENFVSPQYLEILRKNDEDMVRQWQAKMPALKFMRVNGELETNIIGDMVSNLLDSL